MHGLIGVLVCVRIQAPELGCVVGAGGMDGARHSSQLRGVDLRSGQRPALDFGRRDRLLLDFRPGDRVLLKLLGADAVLWEIQRRVGCSSKAMKTATVAITFAYVSF